MFKKYLLLIFWLQCPQIHGNPIHLNLTEELQKEMFPFTDEHSSEKVTFIGLQIEYNIFNQYDFFVPEADVVCQCGCTNERRESCRPVDVKCAQIVNSTTTCTNYITVDSDSSICSKYYKLCCQVYFTKTKMMKPFKALHLKYQQTVLTLNVASKSLDSKLPAYNVTITENVKNLLVNDNKVLHIGEFSPVHPIPEGWFFIEDGSSELLYSDAINAIDGVNFNNIGWFQYNVKNNQLSRVSTWDLEKHLHLKLLDCHSNPPKYDWKLDATHYVRKGLLHLPKNVEKVSEMYKDISKISIDFQKGKIEMRLSNTPSVNFTLSYVNSAPFIFTSSIKERVLNLTFTKGNGTFDVEITGPHWTNIFSFLVSSSGKIIELPSLNYETCWVCVSQHNEQLCQILSSTKYNEGYGRPFDLPVDVLHKSENKKIIWEDFKTENGHLRNTDLSKSVIDTDYLLMIVTIVVLFLFLMMSVIGNVVFFIRHLRKSKNRNTYGDKTEMKPMFECNNNRL